MRREIRGRDHYLHAEPATLAEAQDWIVEYTASWENRADALVAHLRRRRTGGEGPS